MVGVAFGDRLTALDPSEKVPMSPIAGKLRRLGRIRRAILLRGCETSKEITTSEKK